MASANSGQRKNQKQSASSIDSGLRERITPESNEAEMATLGAMVGSQPVKTLTGCVLGLMLATVGLDATSGAYRFTFGEPELGDGIEFVVLVIGLFSISEALIILENQSAGVTMIRKLGRMTARVWALPELGHRHVVVGKMREQSGRKSIAATAIYTDDGTLLAAAEQVWISVESADFATVTPA